VTLRLGTRGSPLALAQAELAAQAIAAHGAEPEVVVISTRGDEAATAPLGELGPGAFASALEEALAAGEVDVAVHSAKDLTGDEDDALPIVGYLERADPRDAWCGAARSLAEVPQGARVGTSSLRRTATLLHLRPDLEIVPIRGNVQTRLDRRALDGLDAVVLAACGLDRLGLADGIGFRFDAQDLVPESGQGAIALQTRAGEEHMAARCRHGETTDAVHAERLVTWRLTGWVASPDGARVVRETVDGPDPVALHGALVDRLLGAGAEAILEAGGA